MLYALSTRHQQKIAWFLLFLFYADFVIAGTTGRQRGGTLSSNVSTSTSQSPAIHPSDEFAGVSLYPSTISSGKTAMEKANQESSVQTISVKSGLHEEEGSDPGQPEMQSFKSIGTDNMVDLFTGDFSYNIPLLDVGGYPVNIFYNSGLSMDQEASWVGLGWNINPGTISRNMRGLPDDFDGTEKVTKKMNLKDDITVGANVGYSAEFAGFPAGRFSLGAGLFYNNYKGFGLETSFGLSVSDKTKDSKTHGISPTAGLNIKFNSQQGSTISPSFGIKVTNSAKETSTGLTASVGYNSRVGIQNLQLAGEMKKYDKEKNSSTSVGLFSGSLSFAHPSVTPSIQMPISRTNYNVGISAGAEYVLTYPSTSISGYYSIGKIAEADKKQDKPAYGFLYMDKGQKDNNALMDFNRLNDGVYTPNTPIISLPVYTYDVYSISGEGTGGSFRPYRGDIGYVKDHYTKTRDNAFSVSGEVGFGNLVEVGVNLHAVFSPTEVGEWKTGNLARSAFQFHENDSIYQGVYFRNPAEKTIGNESFIKALGEDDLVRIKLSGTTTAYPTAMPVLEKFGDNRKLKDTTVLNDYRTTKHQREKRSQIITYLTAEEADRIGLDKKILSYPINSYPIGGCSSKLVTPIYRYGTGDKPLRNRTHISEIDVLNPDGRRYIYGLPVYNISQEETSFATDTEAADAQQIASYAATDNSPNDNKSGHDNFYQSESVPSYAHSFLLTGLLSPDYVDIKGDGITEDDLGDAVKFNYSQISSGKSDNGFYWRAPFTNEQNKASFNEGLKTDRKDNKASYTFGSRELWYLNSIESKNMVATFTIGNRMDAKEAAGENGGVVSGDATAPGMKRLEKIDLYSKADWIKSGTSAKPIKTVHFAYSYKLCQQVPSNINTATGERGKLTLDSIWFSYNGNNKARENRYRFKYHNNPNYDRAANDRWGNYKPVKDAANNSVNLGGMNNTDYPYAVQNKTQADQFAGAWALDEVRLPSGGKINVTYEADDYGYVQNRRAQQMFRIAGMAAKKEDAPQPYLYRHSFISNEDYLCIFIDTKRVNTTADAKRYFEGVKQLYMKLFVTMPSDMYGSGQEAIPAYAEIKDYGVSPNNNQYLYVNVLPIRDNYSPMSSCAIQFLRDYLPSKAFPGSDIKLASGPKSVLLALKGMMNAATSAFSDFEGSARSSGKCHDMNVNRSFIRLNNPDFQKLGGGLRVKRIAISDSWEEMTRTNTPGMKTATYGQEYDYTTSKEVDGKKIQISSGVATYEPGIGAEENPFREILRYSNKQPLGPTQNGASEVPVAEMFYPSPMVGYSKVTVRSVNRGNVKSGVGKQVSEFYTSKDFPVLSDFTDFDNTSKVNFKSNPILQILKLDMRQTTTLTQGFRVQLNDMNGKMKSQSSYAEDTSTLISYTANYYRLQQKSDSTYQLTNNVLAVKGPDGAITQTQVGREVEMMVDFREHNSKTITANLDLNLNVTAFGFFIVPITSIIPPVSYEEAIYRSATVMKVVNRYGILDSVVSIDKGSQVTTRDLVYDGETGNVLLTRTNNEYNAPVFNFNYPAHWAYSGMHPAYRNIDLTYKGLTFRHGILLNSPQVNTDYFESGDELYVVDAGESWIDDTEACALQNTPAGSCTPPQKILKSFEYRIWALDVTKDKANTVRKFIFIDRNGNPYSADNVTMRIVRSGKRNMLNESVGTVTSRFSPLITENGQLKVKPQNTNEVINTAATTYKERWRVDDQFIARTTLTPTNTPTTLKQLTLYPEDIMNVKAVLNSTKTGYLGFERNDNPGYFEAWKRSGARLLFTYSVSYESKTYMRFNFNYLPSDAFIVSSTLSLYPHTNDYTECGKFRNPVSHSNLGYFVHGNQSAHSAELAKSNLTALARTTFTTWAPATSTTWNQIFSSPSLGLLSAVPLVTKAAGAAGISNAPVIADVTGMVRDMNTSRNTYVTGMSLSLLETPSAGQQMNMCFTGKDACYKPTLDIYYYSCGSAEPIAGSTARTVNLSTEQVPFTNVSVPYYCTTYQYTTSCISTLTNEFINPYVKGLLGNWRTERAYTYYGNRREKTITSGTSLDIRSAGAIDSFKTYWNLNADSLRTGGSKEWVWNSEITQFNKRGFEIENHDPLGRYNSGLYGYAQALPVAVANNAKHREITFDGFEDYDYKSSACAEPCQVRHLDIVEANDTAYRSTDAHTGKYSLKLTGSKSVIVRSPVVSLAKDTAPFSLRIHVDSAAKFKQTYKLNGTGWLQQNWQGSKKKHDFNNFEYSLANSYIPALNSTYTTTYSTYILKKWTANYLPTVSGYYKFLIATDDGSQIRIGTNGQAPDPDLINPYYYINDHNTSNPQQTAPIYMSAGTPYLIDVWYRNSKGPGTASLKVKGPCDTDFKELVTGQLYPGTNVNDVLTNVKYDTVYCVKPDTIQPRGNYTNDVFSMLQGKQMVFSAWVKEPDYCNSTSYTHNQVVISFKDASESVIQSETFTPSGPIIEGWQRYDSVFSAPPTAVSCEMKLQNTGGTNVFFDDLRIHPFNANLKSFVYHPSNLRLMAELDENNYASFYEYDNDGTLVRVKKETVKGIKTINETRSALQKSVQ